MPEQRVKVAAATKHAKDQHVLPLDAVYDDVLAYGKGPQAGTQVLVACTANVGMAGEEEKSIADGINKAIGNFETAALGRNQIPDIVEVGVGLGCPAVPSARGLFLGGKAGASTRLHFACKLAHGLRSNDAPLATRKRGFSLIDGRKYFRARALALLPQGQGFPYGVFFAQKASALDCLADKCPLVRSELHFHTPLG